jgi:hypothetical protein
MNIADVAASNEGGYMCMSLNTYKMLYYTSTMYIYYINISVKNAFVGTTKSTL